MTWFHGLQLAHFAVAVVVGGLRLREAFAPLGEAEDARAARARRVHASAVVLAGLGRIAPPLAFVGIVLELSWALGGGSGLLALQRGLPERVALQHALVGLGIGLGGWGTCIGFGLVLRRRARALRDGAPMLDPLRGGV